MSHLKNELLVRDEGAVRWVSIARPGSKNGLTLELNAALIAAIESAAEPSVRALVLTGEGGVFSSGLDLKAAMSTDPSKLGDHLRRYFHAMVQALRDLAKPTIALVDGAAAGFGCDLALACDLRVGTPRTRFGEIFVKRGLMPDGGGTYFLPRLLGLGRAFELLYTGDMVEADEALRIGLVSRIFPVESSIADTLALAHRIAAGPPLSLARIKRAVYTALDGTFESALETEAQGQMELLRSRDFFEGLSAFLEKRPPQFTGE